MKSQCEPRQHDPIESLVLWKVFDIIDREQIIALATISPAITFVSVLTLTRQTTSTHRDGCFRKR